MFLLKSFRKESYIYIEYSEAVGACNPQQGLNVLVQSSVEKKDLLSDHIFTSSFNIRSLQNNRSVMNE